MELVFVVGTYVCLSMAFQSFGIRLDPELVDYPAPTIPSRPSQSSRPSREE
jgi:hypothetical protein